MQLTMIQRSTSDDGLLAIALNNMHRRFERAEIYEMTCRQRIICEIGAEKKSNFLENSFAYSVNSFFGYIIQYYSVTILTKLINTIVGSTRFQLD